MDTDKATGDTKRVEIEETIAHGMALNRVALGFRLADIDLTPWLEYRGFDTPEGRELNETARDAGDNPADWYVTESPVDLLKVSEFWSSRSIFKPKLQRSDSYVGDIKRMVTMCREKQGVYIPPTWLKPEQARELGKRMGLEVQG